MPTAEEIEAEKAGARHSVQDRAALADIHSHAAAIQQRAMDLGHDPHPEFQFMHQKAGDTPIWEQPGFILGMVKAAGDWELDVLANPYGGPKNGKDADGEFFSPNTKFHEDQIPLPPVVYYHGHDKKPNEKAAPMGLPEFIGKTVKRWVDDKGVWYRVVLDKANQYAQRVWADAQKGLARASTGVVIASHRKDKATGEILSWLNGELSIFETSSGKVPANGYAVALPALKAVFDQAGLTLPDFPDQPATPETDARGATSPVAVVPSSTVSHPSKAKGVIDMTDEELVALLDKRDKEKQAAALAEAERAAKEQERIDNAIKAEKAKHETEMAALKAQLAAGRRLPMGQAPAQMHFADTNKYDVHGTDDLNFIAAILYAQKSQHPNLAGPSDSLLKALAIRTAEDKTVFKHKNGQEIPLGDMGRFALKAALLDAGIGLDPVDLLNAQKANELDYSTQSGFGSDWVTINYSDRLWELIRFGTWVLDRMPTVEVPQGAATDVILVQGADPTWYKTGETTANNATTGIPDATVTASKVATTSKTLSVAKLAARTIFSGELIEDSLIPWAANLRSQMELSGAEQLENAIINGDTETAGSTNINAISQTPAGTEVYQLMNGFRKLALVTNTANSRDAGNSLADTDVLATVKLMGAAGKNARDHSKVTIIPDMNTYWKALTLSNLKSIQSFTNSTIENGELTKIWNYEVKPSGFMHANSAKLMANSSGKVDATTDSNNTLGGLLAVRWDQWLFGYKRRMSIETTRFARSDSTEITALTRVGMINRDIEASAETYNINVT